VRAFDEAEVGLAVADHVGDLLGVADAQGDLDVGGAFAQGEEPAGDAVIGDRHGGGDTEPALLVGVEGGDAADEGAGGVQDRHGPFDDRGPGLGEAGAGGAAFEEGQAEAAFQGADPHARGRLADAVPGGGLAEAAGLGDGDQEIQDLQVGGSRRQGHQSSL
jgi:hypothetical protein